MKWNITPKIFQEIQERLKKIENEHNVEILLAIESGSRAWGFDSKDSDYDIRFIYIHKKEYYLSIDKKRDVIEYPIIDLIDINGWDIKKALQLFQNSNSTLAEWIKSPIIYKENTDFKEKILELEKNNFSPKWYIFHYLHMAESNFREYLKWDLVKTKKYFYVLRPILACLWVEKNNTAPPIEFDILLEDFKNINLKLKNEILNLLKRKKNWEELDREPKIQILNNFLEEKIKYFNEKAKNFWINKIETKILNQFFRKYIK